MRRSITAWMVLLVPALLRIHRLHGPPFDYAGLAAAVFASWVGLPGPGEPLLLAAGVLAAKHRLDLGEVLVVAFLAATVGGVVGWAVGWKAGRALATARGPLRSLRLRAIERGEAIFRRYPVIAIVVAPSFVAGVHRVPTGVYLLVTVVSAVVWTVVIGVGGYYIGPPVLEGLQDLGTVFTIIVAVVAGSILVIEGRRRYRRRAP